VEKILLAGRATILAGLLELVRLLAELSSLAEGAPSRGYVFMLLLDLTAGCIAVLVGHGLTQRRRWTWPGSLAVWGMLTSNSAILLGVLLPDVLRSHREAVALMAPRMLFYGFLAAAGPLICRILWISPSQPPTSRTALLGSLGAGLAAGAAAAAMVITPA